MKTSILELGSVLDANAWQQGCKDLGIDVLSSIKTPLPTMQQMKVFFSQSPDWLFMSGHSDRNTFSNNFGTLGISFESNHIILSRLAGAGQDWQNEKILYNNVAEFRLNLNCKLMVWTGCSLFKDNQARANLPLLKKLFKNPVILGFADQTGAQRSKYMLSGRGSEYSRPKESFFHRVKGSIEDPVALRDAWMESGLYHFGGIREQESTIRALDPDGQEWQIVGKKIQKGAKYA